MRIMSNVQQNLNDLREEKKEIKAINLKFRTTSLLVSTMNFPSSKATVLEGLLLKSNLCGQQIKKKDTHRVLIINGGITLEYVHLGFAPKVSIEKTASNHSAASDKEIYQKKCCELILQLELDAVLVREDVDSIIVDFCQSHSILVLPYVPRNILKIICHSAQCTPCVYILDCVESDVLKNVIISESEPDNVILDEKCFIFDLKSITKDPLQTLVLCHPSSALLKLKEHQVWHLMSRLKSVTEHEELLPGMGKVEEHCCHFLRNKKSKELIGNKKRIFDAVINGFSNYSKVISEKQDSNEMLDDLPSKISAWNSALQLVLLVLQCDMCLINGLQTSCML